MEAIPNHLLSDKTFKIILITNTYTNTYDNIV